MRKFAQALAICALSTAPALIASAADNQVVYKACDKKPSPADTEAARGLFSAGKVSYNEGDYPKAIQLWRDAFERDCSANLLLQNLANAYEKAGNLDAAIVSLETLLKRDPQHEEAPTFQKRIENMKKAKAAAAATTPATTAPATASSSKPPPPPTTTATGEPSSAPTTTSNSRPITPLAVAGAGGAIAIIGGLMWLGSYGKYNDTKAKCPGNVCDPTVLKTVQEDADKYTSQMYVRGAIFVGGAAIAGGGLAWYFLSKPEQQASRFFAPAISPGYAGATMGGRF